MKAAVLEGIGSPLSVNRPFNLATRSDDKGEILLLEPGQVLVKVLCSGICGSQLQEIDGLKGDPAHIPHLLGHEGCGIVQETGLGVTHVKRGDKVVMHWRKGAGMDVAGKVYGIIGKYYDTIGSKEAPCDRFEAVTIKAGPITTFSDWSIVSENRVTKIDNDVPNDFACLLGCALSTALSLVEKEADVKPETAVFVIGCGGLGLALILALKAAGVKNVVGHDIVGRKCYIVKELGANFLFNQGSGFDLVLDTTGNYKYLASGRYISLQKEGSEGGGFQPDKDIPRYVRMWRDGKLNSYPKLITHRIKLDQINEGIRLMREGRAGRVLIEMNHDS